ncbi:MAG: recombinase family protein [Clostridiales bacterium]|nr:recombinase family protein [Clostridiales bacterium]
MSAGILAIYLRLSKEDEDLIDESNSIINQRKLIRTFINEHMEFSEYEIREYIDDGFSGKNFERPSVQRLFNDIRNGDVRILIIKDFSRFGRDYIEVGNYIEKIFPFLDVRIIAINDQFDSTDYLRETPGIDVNFKNLLNDYFSEENSIKIKKDLWTVRNEGRYLATFAPNGYKKDENTAGHLVVDEEAANTIYHAFLFTKMYGNYSEAGRKLQEAGFLTPQLYLEKKKLLIRGKYKDSLKKWSGGIVKRIVNNREYLGSVVFHTREVAEIGTDKMRYIPKTEQEERQHMHEPIVSRQLYEDAHRRIALENEKRRRGAEKRRKGNPDSPIKGKLKCGNCRHNLTRRNRTTPSYYCRYKYMQGNVECCPGNIKEEEMLLLISEAIKQQIQLIGNVYDLKRQVAQKAEEERRKKEGERKEIKRKILQIKNSRLEAYEKYSEGEMNEEGFMECKKKLGEELYRLEDMLKTDSGDSINEFSRLEGMFDLYEKYRGEVELNREMVDALISCVYVYDAERVEIVFNFADEMQKMMKFR